MNFLLFQTERYKAPVHRYSPAPLVGVGKSKSKALNDQFETIKQPAATLPILFHRAAVPFISLTSGDNKTEDHLVAVATILHGVCELCSGSHFSHCLWERDWPYFLTADHDCWSPDAAYRPSKVSRCCTALMKRKITGGWDSAPDPRWYWQRSQSWQRSYRLIRWPAIVTPPGHYCLDLTPLFKRLRHCLLVFGRYLWAPQRRTDGEGSSVGIDQQNDGELFSS